MITINNHAYTWRQWITAFNLPFSESYLTWCAGDSILRLSNQLEE